MLLIKSKAELIINRILNLSLKKNFLFSNIEIQRAINKHNPPTGSADGKKSMPNLKKKKPLLSGKLNKLIL
tara:strand:- start:79 stop:291 length:213 start_codon:yes stop_codon:yes gene_type:complete